MIPPSRILCPIVPSKMVALWVGTAVLLRLVASGLGLMSSDFALSCGALVLLEQILKQLPITGVRDALSESQSKNDTLNNDSSKSNFLWTFERCCLWFSVMQYYSWET